MNPLLERVDALDQTGQSACAFSHFLDHPRDFLVGMTAIQYHQHRDGKQDDKKDVFHETMRADGRAWPLDMAEYRRARPRA